MTTIAVIGAGSYGTCLALLLGRQGHDVRFWCRSNELAQRMIDEYVRFPAPQEA